MTTFVRWMRRLGKNRLLDWGAALVAALSGWRILQVLPTSIRGFDFNQFYLSSRLLVSGRIPYLFSLEPMSRQMGFEFSKDLPIPHYPPSFLWMFAPLSMLTPVAAFGVWVGIEVLSLVVLMLLTRSLLHDRLSRRGWIFLFVSVLVSQPLYWQFCYSTVELPLAALVLGAYALHKRGQDTIACLLVAAAGMLKFYPFVLLPWFLWRSAGSIRRRILRGLSTASLCGIIVLVTGPVMWREFVRLGIPVAATNEVGRNFHYAIPTFVTNLGFAFADFHPSAPVSQFWWTAGTIAGLLVIASAYFLCLYCAATDEAALCLLSVAMLAGVVTVQGHYFVWLVFPIACAALSVAARLSARRFVLISLIILAVNQVTPPSPTFMDQHLVVKVLVNYVPLYGLMALGLWLGSQMVMDQARHSTDRRSHHPPDGLDEHLAAKLA